jgi:hypothetical protein
LHLPPDVLGNRDATKLCDAFDPRRDVDAVAQDIVTLDDDVANIDPEELREGGRLIVLTVALRDGDFGLRPLVDAMYGALLNLVDEGFIHSDERKRMAIPMVSRSRDKLAAAFVENGHFAGLSMEHLEVFESEDRNWSDFGTDHDPEKFGAASARCAASTASGSVVSGFCTGRMLSCKNLTSAPDLNSDLSLAH